MNGTYCPHCGGVNPLNVPFCSNCGAHFATPVGVSAPPPPTYYPPPPPPVTPLAPAQKSNRGLIAMICAVLGFVVCGPITSVPGIVLAKMEMDAIREGRAPQSGENTAKWAFYLSIAATAFFVLMLCVYWGRFTGPF